MAKMEPFFSFCVHSIGDSPYWKNDIWALFALALWCIALYTVYRIIWTCTMRSYQAYGG